MDALIRSVTGMLERYDKHLSDEYFYQSLPLCVLDAVFSIGVRYEATRNVVKRFCKHADIPRIRNRRYEIPDKAAQFRVSDYLTRYGSIAPNILAKEVFENQQRTSSRNGILKADAAGHFMRVLAENKVEYLQDIERIIEDSHFEDAIKSIPGQKSGISLQYFFMLAGSDTMIKPDRMVMRFLHRVFPARKFDFKTATQKLQEASVYLTHHEGIEITPRELDHLIWRYERGIK